MSKPLTEMTFDELMSEQDKVIARMEYRLKLTTMMSHEDMDDMLRADIIRTEAKKRIPESK
jgi:hypothetical protein